MQSMRNLSRIMVFLVPYLNPMKKIMYECWETLMQQEHCDLMKFVTYYMRIVWFSEILMFFQITLTHMLIMVAKHVHGWIILQCLMFCLSRLVMQHPPGGCMLRSLCNYRYIEFWPPANDSQHRWTKSKAHGLDIWRCTIKMTVQSEVG